MARAVDGVKRCCRCHEHKAVAEFNKNRSRPDGHADYCRLCQRSAENDRLRAHPTRRRDRKFKYLYGMDYGQYDAMVASQGGMCACHQGPPLDGKPLVVDHDHETGRIRALICGPCNLIIGHAREHHIPLYGAALYLEVYCGK